jgi:DNA-directed RNA polymerase beta subunit
MDVSEFKEEYEMKANVHADEHWAKSMSVIGEKGASHDLLNPPLKIKRKLKLSTKDTVTAPTPSSATAFSLKEELLGKKDVEQMDPSAPDEKALLEHLGEYIEEPFHIIESYFEGQHLERLVRHQIESYNHFVNYQIQRTIQMFNPVVIRSENDFIAEKNKYFLEVFISFTNFKLYPPQIHENNGATKMMLPQEAKLRNFTYASTMSVDVNIQYVVRNTETMETPKIIEKVLPKINIGKLPIMLKSAICVLTQNKHIQHEYTGECSMDSGGYFIIKGSEKTVLGQERAAENKIYCFDGKNTTKWNWMAEIKSVPDFKCISPKQIEMMIANKNNGFGHGIFVNIPRIKQPIELFVLFRALGVMTDKKICEYILLDISDKQQSDLLQALQASVIDSNKYITQEDALRHITAAVAYTPLNMDKETGARKKREFTVDVLNNDLFPHCQTLEQKLYLLGYMVKKLLFTSLGWMPPDDRDSYLNKRIELTGTLLNNLFRNYFNKLVKEMQKQIVREINNGSWRSMEDYENIVNMTNIYKIMKSTTIENGINRALATGDFSIKQSNSSKVGVAQVLNRLTYVSSLSHLRRINTPLEKSGELIAPRKLHTTTWGFLCLTGDTDVLMSDRLTTKKIKDIVDGDWVTTIHPKTLAHEPSDIHSFFCKMPDRLFEITTINGRKVKATANHPFLVNKDGNPEWLNLEDLRENDKLIIRHTVKHIVDENTTVVNINSKDVLGHYKMELMEHNLLDKNIPVCKLKILARLIGALNTDGHLHERIDKDKKYYASSFFVGEEHDVFQLADDIAKLGFGNVSIHRRISNFEDKIAGRTTVYRTWEVTKSGAFSYLLFLLGGFCGKKTNRERSIPRWLTGAELSVKREFLSAFQGGDGSRLSYQKNERTYKPHLGITYQTTTNEYLQDTIKYMTQIVDMFREFEINSAVKTTPVGETKSKVCIVFENSSENLVKYADVIHYAYCEEKRRTSAPIVEHLKMKEFNKTRRDHHYQYIIDNHVSVAMADMIATTNLSENQIRKVISKHKKGVRQTTRFTTDIIYENYVKDNIMDNGCISVPILSIREIEPELVYDFTTRSDNHSFVASSFVCHNCCAETPEGQSIGVVKNISYMAHVTIPTNSSSLYEYVNPQIIPLAGADPRDLHNKVKVFVNGCWLGVTNDPFALYRDMKDKKYRGIVNIYTSIVFDIKNMEIRICNDGGRLTRPVLKVRDNKAIITKDIIKMLEHKEISWNDLLTNCKLDESVVEYIDPEEQNFAMIAMKCKHGYLQDESYKFQYTHCEIHPSTIFGVLASCIPYPDHNQAPRNTYQCLGPDELVWMADGSKKAIRDVHVGEKVLTFHPETLEITETDVINHFVRPNEYPIYKLTTVTGREIIATEDHKFMTDQGWKTVGEMKNDSSIKIGISMTDYSIELPILENPACILTEETFIDKMRELGVEESKNRKVSKIFNYANQLKTMGLLPLYENSPALPILCRMMGFLYADGFIDVLSRNRKSVARNESYVTRDFQCSFDFGTKNDAEAFENDVFRCGFSKNKIMEGTRTFCCKYDNRMQTHHTFTTIHNGVLPAFLISIGMGYGKKTETIRNPIPGWIMKTKEFGRQFIRGFQGGDGSKIVFNKVVNCVSMRGTSQHINPKYRDSLVYFMEQCVSILNTLRVHAYMSKECSLYPDRVKISYQIQQTHDNLIRYCSDVGYAYSETKNNQSFKIVEYLKYKTMMLDKMGITLRTMKKEGVIKQMSTSLDEDFIEKNNCLFMNIDSIAKEPDGLISCIETLSENKSFLTTNAFLSKNCAMAKQAMGIYATNYDQRMDKTAYVLNYPTRPLVDTRLMNFIHLNRIPSGTQIHVAIMTHTGYNQEDSVLINKGSLDRGLFLATIYHTEKDEDKNIIRDEIIRCNPDKTKTKGIKFGNYNKLDANGFIPENELVENRDVIIAKIIPIKENRNDPTKVIKYEDQSKTFRTTEETYIDKNYTGRNGDGYNFAKVRVRILRKPVLGDKFSSRHGQKGTAGNIIPECDMPFTKNGLRPDIIINPHAIPSRMTIGQLKETLLGKVLIELGLFGDGTSFGNLDVKTISEELQKLGYESYGNELMYNGLTGEQLETNIFLGPVFYQRLKHMVNDKQHSRSIGPMVNLTRQPAEGRSRDGGFRIGEMERDVMIAHGMSRFCRERLYDVSDKYSAHVCKKCGMIAAYNDGNKNKMYANADFSIHLCNTCGNKTDFAKVDIPYAYKLLSQELQTINVVPRIITE